MRAGERARGRMSDGLHGLLTLGEKGARRMAGAARALAAVALSVGALALASDAIDRVSSSSVGFAAAQVWREAVGDRSFQERETLALIDFAREQTGLSRLGLLRAGLANQLGRSGAQANFNWSSFRIALGERLEARDAWEQRWVSLHEIGHAAAFSTFRVYPYPLPQWGLSESAVEAAQGSLLYRQAYAESFADVFALALALRLDERDPEARKRLDSALSGRMGSLSLAHDTDAALALAGARLEDLKRARGGELLGLLDALASEGAMRSVSAWGAEREALCSMGAWRWVSWARSEGQSTVTPPWDLASEEPPKAGEPLAKELGELMRFRGPLGPRTRSGLEGELENYLRSSERLALGASANPGEPSWGAELARHEPLLRSPARQSLIRPLSAWARWSEEPRPWGCKF